MFRPDPKPQKKDKEETKYADLKKEGTYKCKYCGEKYKMQKWKQQQRSMGAFKRCCEKTDCTSKAIEIGTQKGMKAVERQRAKAIANQKKKEKQKKKESREKRDQWRYELGKQKKDYLQDDINWIAKKIDRDNDRQFCIANPERKTSYEWHGGHLYGRQAHGAIKYHLWNIFTQSNESNTRKGGETHKMLEGIELVYGKKAMEYIKTEIRKNYPILKLQWHEYKEARAKARKLRKEMENGKRVTRHEANQIIGIYTKDVDPETL